MYIKYIACVLILFLEEFIYFINIQIMSSKDKSKNKKEQRL